DYYCAIGHSSSHVLF
nr:immunoglobulin light chain junction region [Macaca mulatta]